MTPWISDANDQTFDFENQRQLENLIVYTPAVRDFLKTGRSDKKYFIAAPKGMGKTLLLQTKSKMYRNQGGYSFIPEKSLVTKLQSSKLDIPASLADAYSDDRRWITLWNVSLHLAILLRFNIRIPKEIESILGYATKLPDILKILITRIKQLEKIQNNYLHQVLSPQLRSLQSTSGVNQIAIFIDNLDESFSESISQPQSLDPTYQIPRIWLHAQVGLIKVARQIMGENDHIKIFVSLRSEATNIIKGPLMLQMRAQTAFLNYAKPDLREIFFRNIDNTLTEDLVKTKGHALDRFLGMKTIPHKSVVNDAGELVKEDLFEYILRHTFHRPRELMYMGEKLRDIRPSSRDRAQITEVVNRTSHELFLQYQNEIIPFFDNDAFQCFLKEFDSNIIPFEKAWEKSSSLKKHTYAGDMFSFFWRIGLLGVAEQNRLGTLVQRFQDVGLHLGDIGESIPRSPNFYLVHPALDKSFRDLHGAFFNNSFNIVGNGLPFSEMPNNDEACLHVHLGLGRDSLSLIIPELSTSKSIAVIFDSNSEYLKKLGNKNNVSLYLSRGIHCEFEVIHPHTGTAVSNKLFDKWKCGKANLLINTQNVLAVKQTIQSCDTISFITNEGGNIKNKWIDHGPIQDKKPLIYEARRYWKTLPNKKNLTKEENKHIRYEPVIIDRYLWQLDLVENIDSLIIEVLAEEYGQIISRERPNLTNLPNAIFQRPSSHHHLQYYNARQQFITEGTYRFLKVLNQLSKDKLADPERRRRLFELFFDIQIHRIFDTLGWETISRAFNGNNHSTIYSYLVKFCNQTLQRVNDYVDQNGKTWGKRNPRRYVNWCQREKIFPNSKDFYSYINQNSAHLDTPNLLQLKNALFIQNLRRMHSVFISYAHEDKGIAKLIADNLSIRGIHCIYDRDNAGRDLHRFMRESIDRLDLLLFVASNNSLNSEFCHFELQCALDKQPSHQNIICISLDSELLNLQKEDLSRKNRNENWERILQLRKVAITDINDITDMANSKLFKNKLDQIIEQAISKKKG